MKLIGSKEVRSGESAFTHEFLTGKDAKIMRVLWEGKLCAG